MAKLSISRLIAAPVELVFAVISRIRNFADIIPEISMIEILSDSDTGIGTRFRETRLIGKKSITAEIEITDYVENNLIRMVADNQGSIWDTIFTFTPEEDATILELHIESRAYRLIPKVLNPLSMRIISKMMENNMDRLKNYCEKLCAKLD